MGELEAVPQRRAGGLSEIASSRQAQEVQAAVLMARRFPRDTTQSLSRIIEDCRRKGLAEKAVYSYPRGGQLVSGPSIRLAETIARAWGNVDCGVHEIERIAGVGNLPGESVMQAFCWDLETNTRITKTFTVTHRRDTKQGGKNLTDERDIYEMTANYGARRLRACILGIIPIDIIEQAVDQCEKTMEGGEGPIIDRIRGVVLKFKDIGVSQEMLEKRLGHNIEVTTESELVQLKKIGLSIQEGFAKREDFFEFTDAPSMVAVPKSEPKTITPEVVEPKETEKKTKTIKNFAPQTAEQAKTWKPGDHTEVQRPVPQDQGPTREEMGKEINSQRVRIGLSPKGLDAIIKKEFKKDSMALSMDEMSQLLSVLYKMEAKGDSK